MSVYVDIGAKRIQAYLARTPRLKGRRGASFLLDRATLMAVTAPAWRESAEENSGAKQTDGVVSLKVRDRPGEDAREAAQAVVATAVPLLRAHAPGAEWEVVLAEGPSYAAALRARKKAQKRGLERWLPAPVWAAADTAVVALLAPLAEVPVVRLCSECGLDPAEASIAEFGETRLRCPDCVARFADSHTETPAETDLLDRVAAAGPPDRPRPRVAEAFEDLATLGAPDRDENHLCTVFVDGNRFGDLFGSLAETVDVAPLSRDLGEAMRTALAVATLAITAPGDGTLPVLPHLVGGDDLLASVVADRGWTFVRTLLREYRALVADLVGPLGVPTAPTASAGIVFAHFALPFATCVDLAEDALRRAKARFAGEQAAVQWVDVTVDGHQVDARRGPIALDVLDDAAARLSTLAGLPASGRHRLAEVHARAARLTGGDAAPGRDLVAAHAARLDVLAEVRPFLLPGASPSLPDALTLLRWWR